MNRRTFLTGLGALAMPAIIQTPGLLMPVRRVVVVPTLTLDEQLSVWEWMATREHHLSMNKARRLFGIAA